MLGVLAVHLLEAVVALATQQFVCKDLVLQVDVFGGVLVARLVGLLALEQEVVGLQGLEVLQLALTGVRLLDGFARRQASVSSRGVAVARRGLVQEAAEQQTVGRVLDHSSPSALAGGVVTSVADVTLGPNEVFSNTASPWTDIFILNDPPDLVEKLLVFVLHFGLLEGVD